MESIILSSPIWPPILTISFPFTFPTPTSNYDKGTVGTEDTPTYTLSPEPESTKPITETVSDDDTTTTVNITDLITTTMPSSLTTKNVTLSSVFTTKATPLSEINPDLTVREETVFIIVCCFCGAFFLLGLAVVVITQVKRLKRDNPNRLDESWNSSVASLYDSSRYHWLSSSWRLPRPKILGQRTLSEFKQV